MNKIIISGKCSNITFSHKHKRKAYYTGFITSERLSGTCDVLPLMFPSKFIEDIKEDCQIKIIGEVRTRNVTVGDRRKLEIYVFVKEIEEYDGKDVNDVELNGYICKPTIYRKTPFCREITDFILANNEKRKSHYIPSICWGMAARVVGEFEVGTQVRLLGRLQSREYVKHYEDGTEEQKVAYEVSAVYVSAISESEV